MGFPLSDDEHQAIKARIDRQNELVVAAAVRFEGATISFPRPARHADAINWLSRRGLKAADYRYDCGFLTNRGRFVDRAEAGRIVLANDQGSPGGNPANNPNMHLFSEDMWNDLYQAPAAAISPEEVF